MAELQLRGLHKGYGGVQVLQALDLDVKSGEFMVFVGPSGCGKSTLLRLVAGLEALDGGDIRVGGQAVGHLPPAERGVAMVFQSYALYPHMTVAENMGFGLRMTGQKPAQVRAAVAAVAETLQITPLLQRKPRELSGGQRQRVAIGRAIVRRPRVFLFDEPLSNLDAALRVQMRSELARLHRELGTTMIYVTHDQVEAMTLGQRIALFNAGRVEQVGTPLALYRQPANRFVAGFLGSPRMNFVSASDWAAALAGAPDIPACAPGDTLGVRPEHLQPSIDGRGLRARVAHVEHVGDAIYVHARLDGSDSALALRLPGDAPVPPHGIELHLQAVAGQVHVFNPAGQARAQPALH
jgi:multiple sugar transport system ATP-binding protein